MLQAFKQGFILTGSRDIGSLLLVGISLLAGGIICRPLLEGLQHEVDVLNQKFLQKIQDNENNLLKNNSTIDHKNKKVSDQNMEKQGSENDAAIK